MYKRQARNGQNTNGSSVRQVIGKVNIDEEQELAVKYGVMSIPTVVIFKDGQEVSRNVGLTSKHQLTQMIENA